MGASGEFAPLRVEFATLAWNEGAGRYGSAAPVGVANSVLQCHRMRSRVSGHVTSAGSAVANSACGGANSSRAAVRERNAAVLAKGKRFPCTPYMYVWMYVCMYVCMYVHTHTQTHVYTYMHTCIHAYIHTHTLLHITYTYIY
jgi:hypothetical protein